VGARCGQSDEDKIGGNRRIGVHDRSCRGLATAGTSSAAEAALSRLGDLALAGQAAEPGNALTRTESRIGEVGGECTLGREPDNLKSGGTLIAPKALAPQAHGRGAA
jgi:hypothetical protein